MHRVSDRLPRHILSSGIRSRSSERGPSPALGDREGDQTSLTRMQSAAGVRARGKSLSPGHTYVAAAAKLAMLARRGVVARVRNAPQPTCLRVLVARNSAMVVPTAICDLGTTLE